MTAIAERTAPEASGSAKQLRLAGALTVVRLAFRNLGRNRKRTLLALGSIAIAQFFVLAVDGFMAGYGDVMRDVMTGPLLGHVQVHAPDFVEKRSMDLVMQHATDKISALRHLPEVKEVFPRIYAPSLAAKTQAGFVAVVIGIDATAEQRGGGFLDPANVHASAGSLDIAHATGPGATSDSPSGKKRALVGAALARRQALEVGDEVAIIGQTKDGEMAADLVVIAGLVPSSIDLINTSGILMDLYDAQQLFGLTDQVHELTVRGDNPDHAEALARSISAQPAFAGMDVSPWQKGAPELLQLTSMLDSFTWLVLAFVFVAAAAGIANTMLMSAFERVREMGVLLALGATPARIVAMLVLETAFLGCIGLLLGTALGSTLNAWAAQTGVRMSQFSSNARDMADLSFQGINFNMTVYSRTRPEVLGQSLMAMSLTCLIAVLWPIRFVLRLQPTEAMRR